MFLRDVFVCHTSADKEAYARPFARALACHALSCWMDEAQLDVGDSLFVKINEGLRSSRYVAPLITPAFIGRPWPEHEIGAAFSREMQDATVVVTPVLVAPPEEVFATYPLLGDRLCLMWSDGLDAIASRISRRFNRKPHADWYYDHPLEHTGHVWIRVNAASKSVGEPHQLTLRWGPYMRRVNLPSVGEEPVSLVHHKLQPDQVTLHVEVCPPAIVTFGQGRAPDDLEVLDIDEGWTRTAGWNFPSTE